jgi:hypothetical protein
MRHEQDLRDGDGGQSSWELHHFQGEPAMAATTTTCATLKQFREFRQTAKSCRLIYVCLRTKNRVRTPMRRRESREVVEVDEDEGDARLCVCMTTHKH